MKDFHYYLCRQLKGGGMEIFMRRQLNITEGIFPMPVLMVATYNEDGSVNVMNAAGNHAGTGHGSIEPYRIP